MSTYSEISLLLCPFHKDDQLNSELDTSLDHLPGHPRSEDLESISDRLWWMSKQDSANISPLHRQRVKGRQIIYITSHAFWDTFMSDPSQHGGTAKLRKAALGYLRTYFYLIQYESDLRVAQDPALCLVPKEVTWSRFCHFTARFKNIAENEVSGRYHYGEIRLTRLNYYAPILLGKSHYQRENYQYRAYFARIQGPLISVFAFFSIALNCMQVSLAASSSDEGYSSAWLVLGCYWLSTLTGSATGFLMLLLVFLFLFKVIKEWKFAIAYRLRRKNNL
ncbi:hypothetical protein PMG11_07005 [Penicillium brasilianum]|uniref:Subtilisin-like serine protease n=1 Tax=Penicillium brasilianum TaxID=104259 RepID=A0A0F7TR98_PENBI|nr:hypothetical protein PMG11_07005 [Penicillium brasilianum]